ncbi:M15 family metallopeptidase [Brevibacillus dissolubilis]|uniref:M15 family metallopeptidase n=1 Tax=Brevibacillus dissolubilis TaxID=1844116 RepID=UPI001116E9EF|nr:M15 family metallopeptidase [Brevibacillus dissolubilis]
MDLNTLLQKSEPRLKGLHPKIRQAAQELIRRAHAQGIFVLITQGLRSMDQQAEIYAQGRTKPGRIVSYAKPGYSYHNYGLAIDYCLLDDCGKAVWTVNHEWRVVGSIAKTLGFEWGGEWSDFKDYPHLQMTFGLSIRQLLAGQRPSVQLDDDACHLTLNGQKLHTEGTLEDGRAIVPVRAFARELGCEPLVGWCNTTGRVLIDGKPLTTTDVRNGHGHAWIKEVAGHLGLGVAWDGATKTVKLSGRVKG